jgi:pimeloyl-ACP methyl ester carboxylesterase
VIDNWWRQGMMGGAKAHYDCIKAFSETDFTEDLKKIDVPVLVMHGDDDQIVPFADSAPLSAKLVKNGTLKTYPGLPHGMCTTHPNDGNGGGQNEFTHAGSLLEILRMSLPHPVTGQSHRPDIGAVPDGTGMLVFGSVELVIPGRKAFL